MTRQTEIEKIIALYHQKNKNITAEDLVLEAKSSTKYPKLWEYLWGVPEGELAQEARLARAHRLLIITKTYDEDSGQVTKLVLHTGKERGYRHYQDVVHDADLALTYLKGLSADVDRCIQQFNSFKKLLPNDVALEIEDAFARTKTATEKALSSRAKISG